MKFPFFRHKRADAPFPVPTTHTRVASMADRMNETLTRLEEARNVVISEIADKREELRQIDAVMGAMRVGLLHIVDDPTLTFGAANTARALIETKEFAAMEMDIGLTDFMETAS